MRRETFEETGLHINAPELLREWSYINTSGREIACYAYAAESPAGEVRLSHEHTAYAWMTVDEYEDRYCSRQIDAVAPQFTSFMTGMRENCRAFREWAMRRDA